MALIRILREVKSRMYISENGGVFLNKTFCNNRGDINSLLCLRIVKHYELCRIRNKIVFYICGYIHYQSLGVLAQIAFLCGSFRASLRPSTERRCTSMRV